jgi:hypothetical protein
MSELVIVVGADGGWIFDTFVGADGGWMFDLVVGADNAAACA